jgi:8-hydroxy-5-deazaflavin:NADPH oxidoreductase
MKVAILGTGSVGQTWANKLISLGHTVTIGTRNVANTLAKTEKDRYGSPTVAEFIQTNTSVQLKNYSEAVAGADIVVNATKGEGSIAALKVAGSALDGKIIIDIANPLDFSGGQGYPSLLPALSNTNSLGEEIQKTFPTTKVVKTLNTMWAGLMVNPAMTAGGDHTNFICGNDADAKATTKELIKAFGWTDANILDLGDITNARGTEAVLPIWLRIWGATQNGAFNLKVVA